MKIDIEVNMGHSVEALWPYLAEPERWVEWIPGLVERSRIDDGPMQPGSTWKSVDRVGPVRVEFTDKLVEIEPMRRVAFEQSAPWNGWGEYLLESIDETAALLSVRFEAQPTGAIRFLDWFPDALSAYIMKKDYARLDSLLDELETGTGAAQ
jgi:uncharacterized protein YndB with AHSA1/START domain